MSRRREFHPATFPAIAPPSMDISQPQDDLSAGPLPAYRARLAHGVLTADPSQLAAAERLQGLWARLRGYDPPLKPPPAGRLLSRLLRRKPTEGAHEEWPRSEQAQQAIPTLRPVEQLAEDDEMQDEVQDEDVAGEAVQGERQPAGIAPARLDPVGEPSEHANGPRRRRRRHWTAPAPGSPVSTRRRRSMIRRAGSTPDGQTALQAHADRHCQIPWSVSTMARTAPRSS